MRQPQMPHPPAGRQATSPGSLCGEVVRAVVQKLRRVWQAAAAAGYRYTHRHKENIHEGTYRYTDT